MEVILADKLGAADGISMSQTFVARVSGYISVSYSQPFWQDTCGQFFSSTKPSTIVELMLELNLSSSWSMAEFTETSYWVHDSYPPCPSCGMNRESKVSFKS